MTAFKDVPRVTGQIGRSLFHPTRPDPRHPVKVGCGAIPLKK
jgi:hypothetical protein